MFDPLNGNSFTLTFTRAELKLLAFALDFVDKGWQNETTKELSPG